MNKCPYCAEGIRVVAAVLFAFAAAPVGSFAQEQQTSPPEWAERYATSLHATGQGLQTYYSAGNNGLEAFANVPYAALACKRCHEPGLTGGCASCHATADPEIGAQVDVGVGEGQACSGCHGRQAGEIASGFSDVHRDAGMGCMDCHTLEDVMGDGTHYTSKQEEGAIDASCENCHTSLASNAYHDTHADGVACTTCHMQGLLTCYNCHYQTPMPEGQSELLTQVTSWMFLVNKRGKVHPANVQSLIYEGRRLLLISPAFSHTISRSAVSGCGDCHSSKHVRDLADDGVLLVAEFDGANGVRTAEGRIPVPVNFETALAFDYLVYDPDTESWTFLARGQDVTQFLFAEPLSDEQMEKLGR